MIRLQGARFHHLGIACRDLDAQSTQYGHLGYVQEGDEFHDPRQGVRGRFLVAPDQPRIELLVNEGSEVLTPWLDAGVHVYHRAYEVPSVEAGIAELREVRARVVVPPVPAVAFDGRLIAFLMLRNRLLVELIGAHSP